MLPKTQNYLLIIYLKEKYVTKTTDRDSKNNYKELNSIKENKDRQFYTIRKTIHDIKEKFSKERDRT